MGIDGIVGIFFDGVLDGIYYLVVFYWNYLAVVFVEFVFIDSLNFQYDFIISEN